MRTISSTRSAAPWMSGRQLGALTFTVAPLPSMAKPSASSVPRISFSGSLMPASFSTWENEKLTTVLGCGRRAGHLGPGRLAAGHLQHHGGAEVEARQDEAGVDAALEAVARVADDAGLAAGGGGAQRIEVGALDQDVAGLGGGAGLLAAHDAAEAQHGALVGDHAHGLVDLVGLAVEREEALALAAEAGADGALRACRRRRRAAAGRGRG